MSAAHKPLSRRRGGGGRPGRGFRRRLRGRRSIVGEFFLIAFALLWLFTLGWIAFKHGLWQAVVVLSLCVTGGVFRVLLRSNRPW